MRKPEPCTLETPLRAAGTHVRRPRGRPRSRGRDGELWNLRITSVPAPGETAAYIAAALKGQDEATCCPSRCATWPAARSSARTRYHDIVPAVEAPGDRLHLVRQELAAQPRQHHLQAAAADARVRNAGRHVVGWRTDNYNFASQRAIERLGAKKDGVLRAPCPAPRRHRARHRDVQPRRRRMARGQGPAAVPAGQAPQPTSGVSSDADRLLLHPAQRQAAGLGQGIPDAARSAEGRRRRAQQRRRLQASTTSTTCRAPRW